MASNTFKQAFNTRQNFASIFVRPANNYAVLDGLRALCFCWMFTVHCFLYAKYHYGYDKLRSLIDEGSWWLHWVWNSDKAVDTFFFISGFLISYLLFKELKQKGDIKLLGFYQRRLLRLTPAYLVAMLGYVVIRGPNWENLWQNILYINNFFPYQETAMVWTWTLAVEEQFYIIFPLTLLFLFNKKIHLGFSLLILFILSFIVRTFIFYSDPLLQTVEADVLLSNSPNLDHYHSFMYDNLYTRYGAFICGIFISYLMSFHQEKVVLFLGKRSCVFLGNLCLLSLIFILIMIPLTDKSLNFSRGFQDFHIISHRNLFSLCLGWITLLCLNQDRSIAWINRFLSHRFWFPIAQTSYSMYLYHIVFISFWMFQVRHLTNTEVLSIDQITVGFMLGVSIVGIATTFVFGMLSYVFVERPFMNIRKARMT